MRRMDRSLRCVPDRPRVEPKKRGVVPDGMLGFSPRSVLDCPRIEPNWTHIFCFIF